MSRRRWLLCIAALVAMIVLPGTRAAAGDGPDFAARRAAMIETVKRYAEYSSSIVGPQGISPEVLRVMSETERHLFVPERQVLDAYGDSPLPIGHGQTISQPFIVALMTHLLQPAKGHVALEIGTGSGYQAAILAPLVERVCTIEIVPGLGRDAAARLQKLGYANVQSRVGDGYHGWPECGPFDAIVVTAAADHVPPPLVQQLKPGGRMVIPVGGSFVVQHLTLVEKSGAGEVRTRQLLPVRFVPLTRAGP